MGSKIIAIKSEKIRVVSDSITRPANTTAYTAGDAYSEVTTNDHFTFSNVADTGSCVIVGAKALVSSYVATGPDFDLLLFSSDPGEDADNAAATITDAEMADLIGVINFATGSWVPGDITAGAGGNQAQFVNSLHLPVKLSSGSEGLKHIYGSVIMRNAYVPVSSESLTIDLYVRDY